MLYLSPFSICAAEKSESVSCGSGGGKSDIAIADHPKLVSACGPDPLAYGGGAPAPGGAVG